MISTLDLFRIGIGPSSSHTVGPIRIGARFVTSLYREKYFNQTERIDVKLRGSLAFTGTGHGTPNAVLIGLMGLAPETLDIEKTKQAIVQIESEKVLSLNHEKDISFDPERNIIFDYETPTKLHPNEMWLCAYGKNGEVLREQTYYSTGGGFIASKEQLEKPVENDIVQTGRKVPYAFGSADELLQFCREEDVAIHQIIYQNEDSFRPRAKTDAALNNICLLYTSPSPRDKRQSRMPSSA